MLFINYSRNETILFDPFLSYILQNIDVPIMFARNDILQLSCGYNLEHNMDPLMFKRYTHIVKKHYDVFKSVPFVFGGASPEALANPNLLVIEFQTARTLEIGVHYFAFRIFFYIWQVKLYAEVDLPLLCDFFTSIIHDSSNSNNLYNFVRQSDGPFDFIKSMLAFYKIQYIPSMEVFQTIWNMFSGKNALDYVMMMYFNPYFTQISKTLDTIDKKIVFTFNRASSLKRHIQIQYTADKLNPKDFDSFLEALQVNPKNVQNVVSRSGFNYKSYIHNLQLEPIYTNQLNFLTACGTLIPMMSNYGEFGCTTNTKWMLTPIDLENTWLIRLTNNILDNILRNSFWYCSSNQDVNKQRCIHVLRWLSIPYMEQASQNRNPDKLDEITKSIVIMIQYLLRSPSCFPFLDKNATKSIVDYSEHSSTCLVTLSTSIPLAIVLHGKTKTETILFDTWKETMFQAMKLFRNPKNYLALGQYVVRQEAFRNELYTMRNLELIRNMMMKCDKATFLTDTTWDIATKFGFALIEDELKSVQDELKSSREWNVITDKTIQISYQSSDVVTMIKNKCESGNLRAVNYGKGSRSERVGGDILHVGAKYVFGKFSGNNECLPDTRANLYWMMLQQPFMQLDELIQLKEQFKSENYPTQYLNLVIHVWPILNDLIGPAWCSDDNVYRGNRNKTLLINWLGPKTLHYLLKPNYLTYPSKEPLEVEDWATVSSIYNLCRTKFFYPFLNPYTQEFYAYQYLKRDIICLDFTKLHHYNLFSKIGPSQSHVENEFKHESDVNATKHKNFHAMDLFKKKQDLAGIIPFELLFLESYPNIMINEDPFKEDALQCNHEYRPLTVSVEKIRLSSLVSPQVAMNAISYLLNHPFMLTKSLNNEYINTLTRNDFKWLITSLKNSNKTSYKRMTLRQLFAEIQLLHELKDKRYKNEMKELKNIVTNWTDNSALDSPTMNNYKLLETFQAYSKAKSTDKNFNDLENEFEDVLYQVLNDFEKLGVQENQGVIKSFLQSYFGRKEPEFFPMEAPGNDRKNREDELKANNQNLVQFFEEIVYKRLETLTSIDSNQLEFILNGIISNNLIPRLKVRLIPSKPDLRSLEMTTFLLQKSNDMEVDSFPLPGFFGKSNNNYKQLNKSWKYEEETLKKRFLNFLRSSPSSNPLPPTSIPTPILLPDQIRPNQQTHSTYFQDTREQNWAIGSQGFQGQIQPFEESNQCPPNLFTAFELINGLLYPRCGKEGWISQSPLPSIDELKQIKDTFSKSVLQFVADLITTTWCSDVYQFVRVWRWIGIACFSEKSLTRIQQQALENKTKSESDFLHEFSDVSNENKLQLLDELKLPKVTRLNKCEIRIQFISQLMNSNLLFPFVRDHQEAIQHCTRYPNRVVVMLDWSKSGRVTMYRNGTNPEIKYLQAEEFITDSIFAPTSLRLRIFKDYNGGIIADNSEYYHHYAQRCGIQTSLRELFIRDTLSTLDQRVFDSLIQDKNKGQITDDIKQRAKFLKEKSISMQSRNLTTIQIDLLKQIISLEDMSFQNQLFAPLAQKLYKQSYVNTVSNEVKQFHTLSLCSRPEFIGYLRAKYQKLNPQVPMQDIERISRSDLCKALLNDPNLRNIVMPVYVWDLKDVDLEFIDPQTGFVNLNSTDPDFSFRLSNYLIKTYGITLQELKEYNKNNTVETLQRYKKLLQESKKPVLNQSAQIIRSVLMNGSRCGDFADEKSCNSIKVNNNQLCKWAQNCQSNEMSAVDFLDFVLSSFCQDNVVLQDKEIAFIDAEYKVLFNLFKLLQRPQPQTDLIKVKCNLNIAMITELNVLISRNTYTWSRLNMESLIISQDGVRLNALYKLFNGLQPIPNRNLGEIWNNIASLNEADKYLMTILLLIYFGLVTNVFLVPKK
jgi:hypothetical protein